MRLDSLPEYFRKLILAQSGMNRKEVAFSNHGRESTD